VTFIASFADREQAGQDICFELNGDNGNACPNIFTNNGNLTANPDWDVKKTARNASHKFSRPRRSCGVHRQSVLSA
jgi:hypothetical protein